MGKLPIPDAPPRPPYHRLILYSAESYIKNTRTPSAQSPIFAYIFIRDIRGWGGGRGHSKDNGRCAPVKYMFGDATKDIFDSGSGELIYILAGFGGMGLGGGEKMGRGNHDLQLWADWAPDRLTDDRLTYRPTGPTDRLTQ